MRYEPIHGYVAVRCTYGGFATETLFPPNEEQFIYELLDKMKERLYNMEYN